MRTRDILRRARKDGRTAGYNAATWVFDGNSKPEDAKRLLQGLEDGDPAVLDSFNLPNLSGEYADDSTPQTLAAEYELAGDPREEWLLDELCTEWEDAAHAAFWHEVERAARAMLS